MIFIWDFLKFYNVIKKKAMLKIGQQNLWYLMTRGMDYKKWFTSEYFMLCLCYKAAYKGTEFS